MPIILKLFQNVDEALNNDEKSPKGNITKSEILNILKGLFDDVAKVVGIDKIIK
jgi:hypothetical protein